MLDTITKDFLDPTIIVFLVIISLLVTLRIVFAAFERRWVVEIPQRRWVKPEDFFLVLAYILCLTSSFMYLHLAHLYFGTPGSSNENHDAAGMPISIKTWSIASGILYISSIWSAKLSLLFWYKEFVTELPGYRTLWSSLFYFCIIACIDCIAVFCLSCSSLEGEFGQETCSALRQHIASDVGGYLIYAVDVLANVFIMVLPMRVILTVREPFARYFGLTFLYSLGVLCTLAGALRAIQIRTSSGDFGVPWLTFWSAVETSAAVVVCATAAIYGSVRRYRAFFM